MSSSNSRFSLSGLLLLTLTSIACAQYFSAHEGSVLNRNGKRSSYLLDMLARSGGSRSAGSSSSSFLIAPEGASRAAGQHRAEPLAESSYYQTDKLSAMRKPYKPYRKLGRREDEDETADASNEANDYSDEEQLLLSQHNHNNHGARMPSLAEVRLYEYLLRKMLAQRLAAYSESSNGQHQQSSLLEASA